MRFLHKFHSPSGRRLSDGPTSTSLWLAVHLNSQSFPRPYVLTRSSIRSFSCTTHFRKDGRRPQNLQTRQQVQHTQESSDRLTQVSEQKSGSAEAKIKESTKTTALLSDQAVSNKEQRKADWAILKEMSKYLWPKVCFGAGVTFKEYD